MKNKYNINNFFFLPSIYGPSRRIIERLIAVKESKFYNCLMQSIVSIQNQNRPVLVIVKNISDIVEIYNSNKISKLGEFAKLTDDDTQDHRINTIRMAGI